MDKELEEMYKKILKNPKEQEIFIYRVPCKVCPDTIKKIYKQIDIQRRLFKQLVEINKKFNHSNQTDFRKLQFIVFSAFNKYDWIKQMRDIQAQIYVDIMFKHPFLDGNKRTALYWIYKLTHDDYDKFDEYTFKGIIEALGDK